MSVSVGIIGAGGIAEGIHLPCLNELPQARLTAICDHVFPKAQRVAAQFGIDRVYDNYFAMLENEKLDCVFVLVQPEQLFRISMDCLRKGLDVFLEKPPGITSFQAQQLQSAAGDRIVQVGLNRRYIPVVQKVVERMREVTPINRLSAKFLKFGNASFYDGCGSAFICDTIHSLDLLCWVADSEPETAATMISRVNSDVDTGWTSLIRFQNKMVAVLQGDYQTGGRVHDLEIHGPGASAFINLGFGGQRCEATLLLNQGGGSFSLSSSGVGDFSVEHYDGMELAQSTEYHKYYGYLQEDKAFLNSVKTREKPLADIISACRTIQTAEFLLAHKI